MRRAAVEQRGGRADYGSGGGTRASAGYIAAAFAADTSERDERQSRN